VGSSILTYPLITIKYRLQQEQYSCQIKKSSSEVNAKVVTSDPFYVSFRHCVSKTFQQEGVKGFYKGLSINVARVIPTNALFFVVYEKISSMLKSR
jgi:solute carrier family 25 folate transporter 32